MSTKQPRLKIHPEEMLGRPPMPPFGVGMPTGMGAAGMQAGKALRSRLAPSQPGGRAPVRNGLASDRSTSLPMPNSPAAAPAPRARPPVPLPAKGGPPPPAPEEVPLSGKKGAC